MLLSVIIPIYNVEKYLARCLDSVINQSYSNLEIILINDGTPDNSVEIAEFYAQKDQRISIYHQKNAGLSEARNTGMRYATGEYIAFLDSDDWLEPDAYEHLVAILEENDADIAVGRTIRTVEKKDHEFVKPMIAVLNQKEYIRKYFKIGSQTIEYYVWNKLYKREIIEGTEQPKGLYAEDVPSMFMYLLKASKIVVSNKVIHNYFVNQKGLSAEFSIRHLDVLKGWDMVKEMAVQSGDSDYVEWAIFNRKRANFSLLTELALSRNFKYLSEELKPQILDMTNELRKDIVILILGSMPLNRKALLPLWMTHYFFFAGILNKFLRKRG